ncbi:cyanophycinase [Ilumatobacter fluminis]|uniref:Cyanophycinase n=2 Tax=Ilumatobacter fluminis TaxID=467091 RepID=A0A4R7HVW3_9ACTN|nr:cyanophycinase [Ilumatobacter fluminis]
MPDPSTLYHAAMPGVIALQGGDPFVANDDLDRQLLDGIDRVVMLPTADAFEQPADLVETARVWGDRIGVEVEPLMVITRPDAGDDAAAVIDGAAAVFLAGDSAIHLRSAIKNTPVFAAIERLLERGGTLIATGPSASALCDPMTDRRGGAFTIGLGLISGVALMTEIDGWSPGQLTRARELANTPLVELPTGSAIVRRDGSWETVGDAVVHGDLPT